MIKDYRLKRTTPRKFIILKSEEYKILGDLGNCLKVNVNGYIMTFWLSKSNKYFINSGSGKRASRRDEKGNFVTYAINAYEI